MYLINEKYHFSIALHDFLHNTFETFLELTLILGSCYQSSQVQGIYLPALQVFRHIPIHNLLCDAFGDCSLSDSRLSHQYRIVLGPSAKNLKNPSYLFIPADHRVKLSLSSPLVKIDCKSAQILKSVFCHFLVLLSCFLLTT